MVMKHSLFFAIAGRRMLAFSIDWVLIAAWGGLMFGLVMFFTDGNPQKSTSPWLGQLIGFFAMTLPVVLYFSLTECSSLQASVGKRGMKLQVLDVQGHRLSFGDSLKRNAVKFLPWELGHLGAQQLFYAGEADPPLWVWGPLLASMLIPVWWFLTLLKTGRAPYDTWAGAEVSLRLNR